MSVTIGSNRASLGITRQLDNTSKQLSRLFERLSSGARINRASDDAAGLAVATTLSSRGRVLTRAAANLGDATSLLQIADGTLQEMSNVLTRMSELALQASNGSYSSTQRKALDNEYQQLSLEIRRLGKAASFNGISLLEGRQTARAATRISTATANGEAYAVSDNGRYAVYRTNSGGAQALYREDLRTGERVLLPTGLTPVSTTQSVKVINNGDVFFGSGGPTFTAWDVYRWSSSDNTITKLTNSGIITDYTYFDVSADGSAMVFRHSTTTYTDGGTSASAQAGSGGGFYMDLATGIIRNISAFATQDMKLSADGRWIGAVTAGSVSIADVHNGFSVRTINVAGSVDRTLYGVTNAGMAVFSDTANLTGDNPNGARQIFTLDIATGTLRQRSSFVGDFAITFGSVYLVPVGLSQDGTTFHLLTDQAILNDTSSTVAQLYRVDLMTGQVERRSNYTSDQFSGLTTTNVVLAGDGSNAIYFRNGAAGVRGIYRADLRSEDNNFDFEAGYGTLGNLLAAVRGLDRATSGLTGNVLSTAITARSALEDMRYSLDSINDLRGLIGASLSRLGTALSLTRAHTVELAAAENRIKDTDVAADSAALVASQILQNISASLLSQANQQPALSLQLLRS